MSEHFSCLTVSVGAWCGRCQKQTQHRVDRGRKGPCLDCIDKLELQHAAKPTSPPPQISFFEEMTK